MIYSRKYGRYFKNRSELQRHAWWDYRTKPILPWFGLRDCLYSEEYKKEHGLKTGDSSGLFWVGVVVLVLFLMIALGK